ncbi:aromatic ring-hydroxylating dioxygenase subunit alpha [Mycobacterium gastri]|uniref:Vanillate O-demethylase oxygenase n=1 Tax=Mycobacterium gastri TaxID=1777 RepID=A0A1X1V4W8_MYCGS|nr:aromatic ring-hydroxylating dioxygenase subunit alpha [Mycobacterium gastri]ETW22230.1 vanillate O-demethylase oxygenase subunit [Mycobacterium gastri 'Wayne']ORV64071.1 vanillate O-demethylase oxygenase [Mycobacterium gastri]
MRSNYPFNCWYVAATSVEVGQGLLARRLLDRPVVLYRRSSGDVVAMEDRCVHRAYPLSAGRRDGDRLVCGYHGFAYEPDGCLVDVPSQENVPPGARVRSYPVHEQPPFVWIWLGDPGVAALRPPPRVPWYADGTGWGSTIEVLRVEANYLLLHEHYLDLTDVFVMHPEAVPPDIEVLPPLDEVEVSERSVSYGRVTPPSRLAGWEAQVTGLPAETVGIRREEGTFVSPGLHVQHYVIDSEDRRAYELLRIQGFTPESPAATHVFLQMARNYATEDDHVAEFLRAMFGDWALRDSAVLASIQRRLGEEAVPRRDINVKADRAAVRARRIAMEMVDEETGRFALNRILATS